MVNKPTRVNSKSISAIDQINTFFFNSNFKPGIIKANLSHHFSIFMTCGRSEKVFLKKEYTRHTQIIYKIIFSEKQIEKFKMKLHEFGWTEILALEDTNKANDDFLNIFSTFYNKKFSKVEIKLK